MRLLFLAAGLAAAATPAAAGEIFVGLYEHASDIGISGGDEEGGANLQLGFRTAPIRSWSALNEPSLYMVANKNLSGDTDFASVGLSWRDNFSERFYSQFGVGIAVHDGLIDQPDITDPSLTPDELAARQYELENNIAFGSRALIQSEIGIGYKMGSSWSVEASYVHISNAGLGSRNPGMDTIGLRILRRIGEAP